MTGWRDLDGVRQPSPLDDWTADRLLAGMVDPDDAPPGYAGLTRALGQARGPVEAGDLAGRELIVAAVTAAVVDASPPTNLSNSPRRRPMISRLLGTKVAAATIASILLATGAAAATGSLPDPVQGIVSDAADNVGVNLPDGDSPEVLPVVDPDGDDEGDHDDADEVGDDSDDQGDHDDADEVGDDSDPADPAVPGTHPQPEKVTPASQEGQDAHYIQGLRNGDDPNALTLDWKAERDRIHDEHQASHPAGDGSAPDDVHARRDEHLATVADQKAERDALKAERTHDEADDDGDDVAADDDTDDHADEVGDDEGDHDEADDADDDSDVVADDDDADDEDESDEADGHEHDDDEHGDDEANDAPATQPSV